MKKIFEILNDPVGSFNKQDKVISLLFVSFTALIVTAFDPLIMGTSFTIINLLKIFLLSLIEYSLFCLLLFAVCWIFGNRQKLSWFLTQWAFTLFPTMIFSVLIPLMFIIESNYNHMSENFLWGLFVNIVFFGALIWKVILYVLFLRKAAGLKGIRFYGALLLIIVAALFLAEFMGGIGPKTPII
ncbi:hypothetical protein ACYSNR_16955 [Enterococcus sp. LJL128]|uniref:hypothetical protein n=1 Tax=Enterococcus sp. LJL51 TaxID=3416656 RepID=UPI003CF8B440